MAATSARNCNLEDVCGVVGYRCTRILAGWFAGRCLKVPLEARDTHPLNTLIGRAAFRGLVDEFGGSELWIRTRADDLAIHRDRAVADAYAHNMSPAQVAVMLGVTEHRARQLRRAMAANGMIDYARLDEGLTETFDGGPGAQSRQDLTGLLDPVDPITAPGLLDAAPGAWRLRAAPDRETGARQADPATDPADREMRARPGAARS